MIQVAIATPDHELHEVILEEIRNADDIEVVAVSSDPFNLEYISGKPEQIDVFVMDLRSSDWSRLDQWATFRLLFPGARVLGLVDPSDSDSDLMVTLLAVGIMGLSAVPLSTGDLRLTITNVAEGLVTYHGEITENLPSALVSNTLRRSFRVGKILVDRVQKRVFRLGEVQLTDREEQVLQLLAEGLSNREIAVRLSVAERTASFHVSNIISKLQVRSRTEAAIIALGGSDQED